MSLAPRFRRRFCEAQDCNNTSENRSMFQFPANRERSKKWEESIKMKASKKKYRYLCSDHFELWSFTDTFQRRLIKEACPTIQMLPDVKLPEEQQPCIDLCDGSLEENTGDTPISSDVEKDLCLEKDPEKLKDYELIEFDVFEVLGAPSVLRETFPLLWHKNRAATVYSDKANPVFAEFEA